MEPFTIHYADGRAAETVTADFGYFSAIALIVYRWQGQQVVRVATVHRTELDRVEAHGQVWRWDGARPERVAG